MRKRTPVGLMLMLILLATVSCEQRQPVEPPSAAALVTSAPMLAAASLGAVVTRGDIGCTVIDGDGDYFPPTYDGNCGTEVATYSANGNAIWTTRMSGVPNSTGTTVRWGPYNPGWRVIQDNPDMAPGPYPCFLLGPDRDFDNMLATVNWHEVVTASGHATITCIYSEKWAYQGPDE